MDMPENVDEEFGSFLHTLAVCIMLPNNCPIRIPDQTLNDLSTKISIWEDLRKEIRMPVNESDVFRKAVDEIER